MLTVKVIRSQSLSTFTDRTVSNGTTGFTLMVTATGDRCYHGDTLLRPRTSRLLSQRGYQRG